MKLILASTSPRRADILHAAGYSFTVLSSAVDETPFSGESPHDHVQRLAEAKAELVVGRAVGPAVIIAADTVVCLEGRIIGKPRTSDDARQILEQLSGRSHTVLTGVSLVRLPDGERRTFVESTTVHFVRLASDEIYNYISIDEPSDKAGAYAIQGRASRYISRIEGCYFNVVGLPISRVTQCLVELGWSEE